MERISKMSDHSPRDSQMDLLEEQLRTLLVLIGDGNGGDISTCTKFIGCADALENLARSLLKSDVSIPNEMEDLLKAVNLVRSSVLRRIAQHHVAA
jgi:hypothetical protein